ncbi:single-stranded DNA-binding protein [Mucilaginibacter panaciglaebae]|uniref:Single-stranded DNA-binding protein n=1 Tax=Mucilaginibacter panaciglaebae TaxID=502331 RepID=A0ABP7WSD2_9SPHI
MLDKNTVNKVLLMGYISKEPRWHVNNGQRSLCVQLVTSEWIKKDGERLLHEEYHSISIPENLSNTQNLNKGAVVYLQGRIQTKMFLDEKRIKHYRTEVLATSLEVLDLTFAPAQLNI